MKGHFLTHSDSEDLRGSRHGKVLSKENDRRVYLTKQIRNSVTVSKGNPAMMTAMVYQD